MPVDADSLGEYLRRERERRHVSLQDISAATKVQLTFLQALEHDEYDRLPPAPFVTGFLRAYAQCLGLEPEEIITSYHKKYGVSESPRGYREPVAYRVERSRDVRWKGIGIAVAVMILIIGLAWHRVRLSQEGLATFFFSRPPVTAERTLESIEIASQSVDTTSDSRPPQLSKETSAALQEQPVAFSIREAEQTVDKVSSSEPPVSSLSESGLPNSSSEARPPTTPLRPMVLQAIAVEDTWLRVDIDGGERRSLLLSAGKRVNWEASERFVLKIGNAQGTRLTLNGRDVSLPLTRDNVVRDFVLTRDRAD